MKVCKSILLIVAALIIVFVAQRLITRSEPPRRAGGGPVAVTTETVEAMSFADRTEAIGTVLANESVTITPAVTERVARIRFTDGSFVAPGDTLIELVHAEESAAVEEARVGYDEQRRQFERVRTLHERGLVSQEELDAAQGDLDAARARVTAAEARLNDRVITAPFAGVLGIRRVSPGTLVSPGTVITTLDDLSVVKVDFTVPEALLADIAIGQSVTARATPWPAETFEGSVTSVDTRVDPATRAVALQARIPNPEQKLRTGMLLTVELTCCPREAPGVPERALLSYADRQYVYVVREDRTVEQREVELGARDVGFVEVARGLTPGETIVVDGLLSLRDGAQVSTSSSMPDQEVSSGQAPR